MENTLTIQEGKRYKLRNGLITDKVYKSKNGTSYIFSAPVQETLYPTPSIMCWLKTGHYLTSSVENRYDIIEEIQ